MARNWPPTYSPPGAFSAGRGPQLMGGVGGGGDSLAEPEIRLSANSAAEDAIVGTTVGTLSVVRGVGTYVFTMTDTAGDKFAVDGNDIEVAGALDFETATFHYVTIRAASGHNPVLFATFRIEVTDVAE